MSPRVSTGDRDVYSAMCDARVVLSAELLLLRYGVQGFIQEFFFKGSVPQGASLPPLSLSVSPLPVPLEVGPVNPPCPCRLLICFVS